VATYEEIEENDFNLNIPRYVDTFEEPEPIDVVALKDEMKQTDQEIEAVSKELLAMVDDLAVTDDTKDIIDALKEVLG
ncbi:MAG: type I restriction-modification system subunit M, partial [Turicibacter bilis]|nr:type I restriction-modification system subunit M [Turicibacter bilis]